jgi:hypothetical protein
VRNLADLIRQILEPHSDFVKLPPRGSGRGRKLVQHDTHFHSEHGQSLVQAIVEFARDDPAFLFLRM